MTERAIYWPTAWTAGRERQRRDLQWRLALASAAALVVILILLGAGLWLWAGGLSLLVMLMMLTGGRRETASRRGWRPVRSIELLGGAGRAVVMTVPLRSIVLILLACLVFAPVFAWMPAYLLDHPPTGYSSRRWLQVLLYSPPAAVYCAAHLFSRLVRKRWLLGVGMSSDGVYHWSWFGCCFYAWDTIRSVRATARRGYSIVLDSYDPEGRPRNPEENHVGRWSIYRNGRQRISAGVLGVNPAVAYYALEFYRRHPELRHELSGAAGVERIQTGNMPEVIQEVKDAGDFGPSPSELAARLREMEEAVASVQAYLRADDAT